MNCVLTFCVKGCKVLLNNKLIMKLSLIQSSGDTKDL